VIYCQKLDSLGHILVADTMMYHFDIDGFKIQRIQHNNKVTAVTPFEVMSQARSPIWYQSKPRMRLYISD